MLYILSFPCQLLSHVRTLARRSDDSPDISPRRAFYTLSSSTCYVDITHLCILIGSSPFGGAARRRGGPSAARRFKHAWRLRFSGSPRCSLHYHRVLRRRTWVWRCSAAAWWWWRGQAKLLAFCISRTKTSLSDLLPALLLSQWAYTFSTGWLATLSYFSGWRLFPARAT